MKLEKGTGTFWSRKNDRREEMKLDQIGFWSEIKLEIMEIISILFVRQK